MTLREQALIIAAKEVGVTEQPKGSNSGPRVNQYLKAVGLNPGYAWCQAFVYWCYAEAAKTLNVCNAVPKTAGVLDCWNRTAAARKINPLLANGNPGLILPGYQMILRHSATTGHTCLVEGVERTRAGIIIKTIEGNTNADGSREGYAVCRRQRKLGAKETLGFIIY
jgi:hypothetical protein